MIKTTTHRRVFLSILLVCLVAACHDGPTVVTNGIISAKREASGVRLTNQANEARGYMVNDPEWLAVADLSFSVLCTTTDSGCLRLPANGSVVVPFADIGGYSATTKTVVIWTWRVMPNGAGGFQAVSDDAITLTF